MSDLCVSSVVDTRSRASTVLLMSNYDSHSEFSFISCSVLYSTDDFVTALMEICPYKTLTQTIKNSSL